MCHTKTVFMINKELEKQIIEKMEITQLLKTAKTQACELYSIKTRATFAKRYLASSLVRETSTNLT